jgi:hypothetical protein
MEGSALVPFQGSQRRGAAKRNNRRALNILQTGRNSFVARICLAFTSTPHAGWRASHPCPYRFTRTILESRCRMPGMTFGDGGKA